MDVAFTPDGKSLASADARANLAIWGEFSSWTSDRNQNQAFPNPTEIRLAVEAAEMAELGESLARRPTAERFGHRAWLLAHQERWAESAADYDEAIRHHDAKPRSRAPGALALRYYRILTALSAGDCGRLRRFYNELLSLAGPSTSPLQCNTIAWDCSVVPDLDLDRATPVVLAERAVAALSGREKGVVLNTLALALYRAGRFEESIRRSNEAIVCRGDEGSAQDWAALAMAHYRLGHHGEARSWLGRFASDRRDKSLDTFWAEVEIRLLRSEAESLVLYDPAFPADPFARNSVSAISRP